LEGQQGVGRTQSQDQILRQILAALQGGGMESHVRDLRAFGLDMALNDDLTDEDADSRERMRATLLERARALAKTSDTALRDGVPLVVFSLAEETYGVPTRHVRDVQPLRQVTPVPCTPDFVIGVINIRGSIYSVIDIRSFFGVCEQTTTPATKVIVVDTGALEVGILADDVSGALSVPRDEINPPLAAQATVKEQYVQGVTNDMLIILDLEALLKDDHLAVCEEVG